MRDSVPSPIYSAICNVLRQWKTSLIPTYRVYRLYDIYSISGILRVLTISYTVDREMFAVKKFSPLAQVAKILRAKISRAQTARAIFARLIFAASVGGEN